MVGKSTPVRKAGKNLDVAVGYPFRSLGGTTSPLVIHNLDRVYQDSDLARSEEHTSELQSLMRISYAVFCLQKNNTTLSFHNSSYTKRFTANTQKSKKTSYTVIQTASHISGPTHK